MSKMIHTPGVVKTDEDGNNQATFTIEPLHSGYGMTLGNSIRRVLLSSIAGAAITSFKIISTTSSFTLGSVVNSWLAPSTLNDVIAAPAIELKSTRRMLLPSVIP